MKISFAQRFLPTKQVSFFTVRNEEESEGETESQSLGNERAKPSLFRFLGPNPLFRLSQSFPCSNIKKEASSQAKGFSKL